MLMEGLQDLMDLLILSMSIHNIHQFQLVILTVDVKQELQLLLTLIQEPFLTFQQVAKSMMLMAAHQVLMGLLILSISIHNILQFQPVTHTVAARQEQQQLLTSTPEQFLTFQLVAKSMMLTVAHQVLTVLHTQSTSTHSTHRFQLVILIAGARQELPLLLILIPEPSLISQLVLKSTMLMVAHRVHTVLHIQLQRMFN